MSIATDVRAYADLALEQGKVALNQAGSAVSTANKRLTADAGKPALAALGAADLLAEALGKQAEALGRQAGNLGKRMESLPELPAAAAGNLAKAQESGKALLDRAQEDALARIGELRERLDAGLATMRSLPSLPEVATGTTSGYLEQARQAYGRLTARGETRWADLRKDPRVNRLLDLDGTAEIDARIDSTVQAVKEAGEPAGTAKPKARKAPAAKSGTTRPAPAKKA